MVSRYMVGGWSHQPKSIISEREFQTFIIFILVVSIVPIQIFVSSDKNYHIYLCLVISINVSLSGS